MKTIFKTILLLSLSLTYFSFYSCSSLKVISDVNKSTNFKQYKTYRWATTEQPLDKNYPQFDNTLNRQRIRRAIDISMENQEYTLANGDTVDLEVDFHIQFKQIKVPYHSLDYYEGDFYNGIQTNEIYQYEEGILIIHLIDLKQKQLVWQGVLSRVLDVSKLEEAETEIQKNISKLFKKFNSQISE